MSVVTITLLFIAVFYASVFVIRLSQELLAIATLKKMDDENRLPRLLQNKGNSDENRSSYSRDDHERWIFGARDQDC